MEKVPCIFVLRLDGVDEYWTGEVDRDGRLDRSLHRADAYKFTDWDTALQVSDTHDELRNSDTWKIAPFRRRA